MLLHIDIKFLFECCKYFMSEHSKQLKYCIFQHEKKDFVSLSDHVMKSPDKHHGTSLTWVQEGKRKRSAKPMVMYSGKGVV